MGCAPSYSRLGGLTALILIVWAAPSQAFRMLNDPTPGRTTGIGIAVVTCDDPDGFTHWTHSNINWYHNPANQGAGKAAALYNAMNVWTFVNSASQSPTYAGTTSAGFTTDGINTLSWGTGNGCSGTGGPGTCLALTALVLQSGQVIVESDVTFNNDVTWTTNGNDYDTWAVAAHELGHTMGIGHSDVTSQPLPTMHAFYNDVGGLQQRTLEADDKAALQCSQTHYPTTVNCVPDGGVDDTLSSTSCCSGVAVTGSTYCLNPADWGTTWASCYQICGTPLVGGCVPSGGIDDTLTNTSCCSGSAVPGSTRCLNPADYGGSWTTCVQTCQ